jgi:hypothetical protein
VWNHQLATTLLAKGATIMPRFFISFQRQGHIIEDDEGQEFPRLEVAEAAALKSGRELLSNNIKYASDAALEAVIVANDRREEILRISVKDLLQGRRLK